MAGFGNNCETSHFGKFRSDASQVPARALPGGEAPAGQVAGGTAVAGDALGREARSGRRPQAA